MSLALVATHADGATFVLDQIGDASHYQSEQSQPPAGSQFYEPAFAAYDSMAIDDFTVTEGELNVTGVAGLFLSQAGFEKFAEIEAYQVSIFSSAMLAGISLHGDVASLLVSPNQGAVVTAIGAIGLGFVNIEIDINLPAAGTYWVGISPVASVTGVGSFFLQNQGSQGGLTLANSNGRFANPGLGNEQGALAETGLDYAYQVTAVPEPAAPFLALGGVVVLLSRRGRGRFPRES